MKGGEVIGSGSYGCVFKPPLPCKKTKKNKAGEKNLSKMMLNYEAIDEYNYHTIIKDILKKYKNYKKIKKYYIFSNNICKPAKLNKTMKKNLIEKCSNMVTNEYSKTNEKNLYLLNMPYGGIDLDSLIITNMERDIKRLKIFINKLIDLLIDLIKNGIKKLHKKDIYHTDIKSLNILKKNDSDYLSIIDWGLCEVGLPDVYKKIYSSIHFNRPYESLLFNIPDKAYLPDVDETLTNIIYDNLEKIASKGIQNDIFLLFKLNDVNDTIKTLKNYLINVYGQLLKNEKFDREKLIKAFYIKQDYWGLMTVLLDLYRYNSLYDSEYKNDFFVIFNYFIENMEINSDILISLLKKLKR